MQECWENLDAYENEQKTIVGFGDAKKCSGVFWGNCCFQGSKGGFRINFFSPVFERENLDFEKKLFHGPGL